MRAIGTQLDWTTLLDDDDINAPIEIPGFPEKMDGEERTTRSTADYGNAVAVLEATSSGRCEAHGPSLFGKDAGAIRAVGKSQSRHKRSIPVD